MNNLVKALGLEYGKDYSTIDNLKSLRYGKLLIMMDQDHDGIHIIGLILNAFHVYWPSLIKLHFLELFITPIVTVRRDNSILEYYSLPEYHVWKYATKNIQSYKIKYNKGLGGVAENDIKKYFSNINDHRIKLCYMDNNDDDAIEMAFSKKKGMIEKFG
ncbi:dna topoisomerase 2-alpha-like protein [Dermatophagoides farinae]|uniref:DNA topoisomerase (ATP-hydrolyzing) n=1 Tax=Dermatophagoides farinae TaxID=6954 RepID=A0A9D4PA35_DERFA|nr:dna topoisomerase 2-alpha-like protein [Dermatophagoides farinae]